jgi:DNA-binding transcriptional ArsR family regulator/uncharacterized protein YndB with AHSA1/START domain
MDAVFRALGDPARRRLLDRLNERNGLTLTELCADMGMTRQSVSKHLVVLEEAEVVTTVRRGREKLHYLNAAPINDIADRWIHHYDRQRAEALADLKTALEATPMDQQSEQTSFVYTTYVNTTPERVWQGLTEPAFTERYWGGVSFPTDWRKGSTYDVAYREAGLVISDPAQVILEADPYRRLSYTWHTFTPEWGDHHGRSAEEVARLHSEPRSKVAFDIEETGPGMVKLTVVHDGFEPGSAILAGVSGGWPAVIASLKTLLETGSALPAA